MRAWVLPPLTAVAAVPVEAVAPAVNNEARWEAQLVAPGEPAVPQDRCRRTKILWGVTEFYLSLHVVDRKKST